MFGRAVFGLKVPLKELEIFLDRFLKPLVAEGGPGFGKKDVLIGAAFLFELDKKLSDSPDDVPNRIKAAIQEATEVDFKSTNKQSFANPEESLIQFVRQNSSRVPPFYLRKLLEEMKRSPDEFVGAEASQTNRDREFASLLVKFITDSRPGWLHEPLAASVASPNLDSSEVSATTHTQPAAPDRSRSVPNTSGMDSGPVATQGVAASKDVATKIARTIEWPAERWEIIAEKVTSARSLQGTALEESNVEIDKMRASLKTGELTMALVPCPIARADKFIIANAVPGNVDVWFIGDIHCDLLALEGILQYIEESCKKDAREPWIVFLGDLFDDGDGGDGDSVVRRIMHLLLARPGAVAVLAGNHDEALAYDDGDGRFSSAVTPNEFCDWLNEAGAPETRRVLGRTTIELFQLAPRAILLEDGLLVAHGGVPHTDLQQNFAGDRSYLNHSDCLQDFVWTRAHDTAKHRIPNRSSKGCSFGIDDFNEFCDRATKLIGKPVERMIRGHDHVQDRYKVHEQYAKHPLLTINAMCCQKRDVFGPYVRVPCVARWVRNELPEVHRLIIPEEIVERIYPPPTDRESSGG